MNIQYIKNRNRKDYTFANINLLGVCNANCYFCLGKDIECELKGKNQLKVSFLRWKNFCMEDNSFLMMCKKNKIKKLYITGQTADGLQYKYLDSLLNLLQNNFWKFSVGVRTNGYLAEKMMPEIKKMKDEIGYSIHTLNSKTNKLIMNRKDMPNWDKIIPLSGDNVRVSIVINRYNKTEIYGLCKYLSKFDNIKYIQLRRIASDTRLSELQQDLDIYEEFYNDFKNKHTQVGNFYNAQKFELFGKEVIFWRTVETSVNSLNYFTDGTCSDEYFIVEGYLKNQKGVLV